MQFATSSDTKLTYIPKPSMSMLVVANASIASDAMPLRLAHTDGGHLGILVLKCASTVVRAFDGWRIRRAQICARVRRTTFSFSTSSPRAVSRVEPRAVLRSFRQRQRNEEAHSSEQRPHTHAIRVPVCNHTHGTESIYNHTHIKHYTHACAYIASHVAFATGRIDGMIEITSGGTPHTLFMSDDHDAYP